MIKEGNVFFKFYVVVKISLFFIVSFIGCNGSQIDDLTKEKEKLNSQIRGLKTKINEKEQALIQEISAKEKIETDLENTNIDLENTNTNLENTKEENWELKANLDKAEVWNAVLIDDISIEVDKRLLCQRERITNIINGEFSLLDSIVTQKNDSGSHKPFKIEWGGKKEAILKGTFTSSRKIDAWVFKYQNYQFFRKDIESKATLLSKDLLSKDIEIILPKLNDEYYLVFINYSGTGKANVKANFEIKWTDE